MKVKTYKTEKSAKSAVKRAGLSQVEHNIHYHDERGSKGYTATFYVDLHEDIKEINNRGFMARLT